MSDKKSEKSIHFDSKKVAYIFSHPSHMACLAACSIFCYTTICYCFSEDEGILKTYRSLVLDWDEPIFQNNTNRGYGH